MTATHSTHRPPAPPQHSRRPRPATAARPAYLFLGILVVYFLVPFWWLIVASTKDAPGLFGGGSALWFADDFALFDEPQRPVHLQRRHLPALARATRAVRRRRRHRRDRPRGAGRLRLREVPVPRSAAARFAILLGSVMVPLTALVIPTFMLFSNVGLTNTIWAVILPTLLSPFGVYLMQGLRARTPCPTSCSTPPASTARASCARSSGWPCRCCGPRSSPCCCCRSSAPGTTTSCRWPCCPTPSCSRSPSASACGRARPRPTTAAARTLGPHHHRLARLDHPAGHRLPDPAEVLAGRALRRRPQMTRCTTPARAPLVGGDRPGVET